MPVSLTRVCPSCNTEKATPADFRDPGESGAGRPPKVCAECRASSPALQLQQQRNVERRAKGRAYRAELADRPSSLVIEEMLHAHPMDMKLCPPVGGCGARKHLSEFHLNTHQVDGLAPVCASCSREAAALRKSNA